MTTNHQPRVTAIVKDALVTQCTASGVDKTMTGFSVSLCLAPMDIQGQTMLIPSWLLLITLRTTLLGGQGPVTVPISVPGPMPPDDAFRAAVKQALEQAVTDRDKAMAGVASA
jgi:hypothetical protein